MANLTKEQELKINQIFDFIEAQNLTPDILLTTLEVVVARYIINFSEIGMEEAVFQQFFERSREVVKEFLDQEKKRLN